MLHDLPDLPVEVAEQCLRRAMEDVLVGTELARPPAVGKLQRRVGPISLVIRVEGYLLVPGLKLISSARYVAEGREEARQRGEVISCWAGPIDPGFPLPARVAGGPGNAVVGLRLGAGHGVAVGGEVREGPLQFGAHTAYPRCRPQSIHARAVAST